MIYDLSPLAMLTISGTKADDFLQGQLTCDITQASAQQAILGAHCNLKGRIVSLFHLFKRQEQFCLVMPLTVVAIAEKALRKYAQFFKDVEIKLHTILPYVGVINENPTIHFGDHPVYGIQPNPQSQQTEGQFTDWQDAMIQNHHAWLTPETLGKFLPHEIDLPKLGGVSFTKGCFIGQEIIARMEYLGKLKKQMILRESADLTKDDTVICQNQTYALVLTKMT